MKGMSEAETEGIQVSVVSRYLKEQSAAAKNRFVFAYTVTITNVGTVPATLRTRHWVITDASQKVEEVRGEGVVGEQPHLEPDQSFEYTSGCVLQTPWGTMHGSYQMERPDGGRFDARIETFLLAAPFVTPAGAPS